MRWFADECVHAIVVKELRNAGHDVIYAAEIARQTEDSRLAERTRQEGRILLTEDKDFGEIAFRNPSQAVATVLLRWPIQLRRAMWPQLQDAIAQYGDKLARGFTVIDETRVRYRSLDDIASG
ncbi:MAG: DUF5615 family PIN-like protein [Rhizomicrobium sp.]